MGLILLCVVSAGSHSWCFCSLVYFAAVLFLWLSVYALWNCSQWRSFKVLFGIYYSQEIFVRLHYSLGGTTSEVTFHLNFHLRLLGPLRNVNRPHKHSWLKIFRRSLPSPLLCSGVCLLATSVQWDCLSFVLVSWCSSVQGLHAAPVLLACCVGLLQSSLVSTFYVVLRMKAQ